MEFARRARKLYADREAVVDGSLRLTYQQFFDRCDRWSAALQQLGVRPGDRVAYIAPNSPAQLESFYAVPQIGAVTVPINYRLVAEDFAYIIGHSGARVVCAHSDYLDAVDRIRGQVPEVEHFVALEGGKAGWLDYEATLAAAPPDFVRPEIRESDLLSLNYTSGTTARPKGVMITHRNAWHNIVGTLLHLHMTCADRYLWTLPMFHANGWTFVWIVTAVGGAHVCLRKSEPQSIFENINRESVTLLCAAPTVLIGIANASEELRRLAPRGVRVLTAGAPPAAATIERIEGELGWEITQAYGLTEVSPLISICEPRPEHARLGARARAEIKARQGVELLTSGDLRVVDEQGSEVPRDGQTVGEIVVRGNVVMAGYYRTPRGPRRRFATAGSTAAMRRLCIPTDISKSGTGSKTSSSAAARIFHPLKSRVCCCGIPPCRKSPWWVCRTKNGARRHMPSSSSRPGAVATEAELRQFAREHIAHFKVPQGFTFVAELPKTATGKIQKYLLRGGPNISRQ